MDLQGYVESIQRQLVAAADAGGDDARALAERLVAPLDAAVRLTVQEALAVAVEQITCELAPGSVELRVRGRDLEFVVTPPPGDAPLGPSADDADDDTAGGWTVAGVGLEADEGSMSRINLRLPDHLKARIEQAAGRDGLSVNAWLVRAAAASLERGDRGRHREPRPPQGNQRYRGWAR